jgi:hypothetical protein
MSPLISDFALTLALQEQSLLFRWAIKTSIVFERANPTRRWFYTRGEAHRLRTCSTVPDWTTVWIGRHAQSQGGYTEGRRLLEARPDSFFNDGYVNTFAFDRLVLQAVTQRRDPAARAPRGRVRLTLKAQPGPWEHTLVQIWPTKRDEVRWPPPRSFSESGITLDELAGRFRAPR